MIKNLGNIIIDIVPYLFPMADTLMWLLTGDLHAFMGIIGNCLNILFNFAIRRILGTVLSGWATIYSPENSDKGVCELKAPSWVTVQGGVVELPSLHAQQVAFYSCYWLLCLSFDIEQNLGSFRKIIALILLQLLGFTVSYVRYITHYSSVIQIIIGYIIGALMGIGYYFLIRTIVVTTTNNDNGF